MTKDEWLLVKNRLSQPWGVAELMVDGYRLTLQVRQAKALKFEIAPYVNGQFKGAWTRKDSEEGKRFLRPVTVAVYKPAEKARMTKGMSKKMIKSVFGDRLDTTFTIFAWGWPTFGPLQRHLIANNQVIGLVGDKPME
jgi:hypothetical protein